MRCQRGFVGAHLCDACHVHIICVRTIKTNEDILSELHINPAVKKFKITEINEYNVFGDWTERDCHS
jgi:hypothetical protein